jgi:hypothetical protein
VLELKGFHDTLPENGVDELTLPLNIDGGNPTVSCAFESMINM